MFNLTLTIYPLAILILDAVIYKFDSSKISTRGGSLVSGIDKKRHQLMVIFGRKHSNFGSWYVALSLVSTIALLFLIRTMAFMRYAPRAPTYNGFQDIWDVHSTTVINTKWRRDHVIPLATNILATISRIHTV